MGSPRNLALAIPKNPAPALVQTAKPNPYLTASDYENMQLHTPSGLYYNNGKFYEPYTPNPLQRLQTFPYNTMGGMQQNQKTTGGTVVGSISSGDQWFRPFTGNATGINMGEFSPAYALTQAAQNYQPQPLVNLFSSLDTSLLQSQPTGAMEGASRFLSNNLLGSPIVTTNTQGK